MKSTIVILVVLGLVAAMCAVLLVTLWPTFFPKDEKIVEREIDVLVATHAIPAYTHQLAKGDLELKAIKISQESGDYANPNAYLTDSINAIGKTVSVDILEGQPVFKDKIITDLDWATMMKSLTEGMRAYPVRLSEDQIVGGMLSPNCFVDVVVISRTRAGAGTIKGEAVSKTFLERIKVIAVQGELSSASQETEGGASRAPRARGWTVTLLVNSAQAEALALATSQGEIALTLRGQGDEAPVDSKGTVWDSSKIGIMGEFFDESVQQSDQEQNSAGKNKPGSATRIVQVIRGPELSDKKVPVAGQAEESSSVK